MILLGCLLAFSIAIAPRLVLILAWNEYVLALFLSTSNAQTSGKINMATVA